MQDCIERFKKLARCMGIHESQITILAMFLYHELEKKNHEQNISSDRDHRTGTDILDG